MSMTPDSKPNQPLARTHQSPKAIITEAGGTALLPLGAMLLAGSLSSAAFAQATPPAGAAATLPTVTVQDSALDGATHSKTQLRATRTEIGKGNQELRDIPQSVTVMTEKLIQDRNMDDFREVLRATAGVTFQAWRLGNDKRDVVLLAAICGLFGAGTAVTAAV